MPHSTLISTGELDEHRRDLSWVIVDCRFQLQDPEAGRRAYEQAHIPGAVYAHLNDDLSGPIIAGRTGRHPLPEVQSISQRFSAWGIDAKSQVVAYDDVGGGLAAARCWWLLRWLGHEAAAVLNGGWKKWEREGRPVTYGAENGKARIFEARPRPELVLDSDSIQRSMNDPNFRLFDVRTAERYRGENEVIDPIAGHIPGAISAPYLDNLDGDGLFKSPDQLQRIYRGLLGGGGGKQAAFYCGSGVTAAQSLLALVYAGLGESRLYAGSWSEWITDPGRPIQTGK